jgi:transcriptional regulator with XRE-family HTH domain
MTSERGARDARAMFVGADLRARRQERGLSVRALAREAGVSPSLISQIENGRTNSSLQTLSSIVAALGLSLPELLGEPAAPARVDGPEASPRAPRSGSIEGPVLRRRERRVIDLASGVRWERLTPAADRHLDFLLVTYAVGGESCPPDALATHGGREFGLVLSGRLGVTMGFESFELQPGDSVVLQSVVPHRLWTIGDEPCVVVWSVTGREADPRPRFDG